MSLRRVTQLPPVEQERFWEEISTKPDMKDLIPSMRCHFVKLAADELFDNRHFFGAVSKYKEAMRAITGPDVDIPPDQYLNSFYLKFVIHDPALAREHLDLIDCCDCIAKCYVELGDLSKALDWLQETEVLFMAQRLKSQPNDLPWVNLHSFMEDHFVRRICSEKRYSSVLWELGNTAMSQFFLMRALNWGGDMFEETPTMLALRDGEGSNRRSRVDILAESMKIRHPEPSMVDRWKITEPRLQIKGAWTKLNCGKGKASRFAFSAWIWNSKLYVCFGQNHAAMFTFPKDLWCLNLVKLDGWRQLPDFPGKISINQTMRQWEDKAWLFNGTKTLWAFDLRKETWSKQKIQPAPGQGPYPYSDDRLTEHSVEIFEGIMYVFGGDDGISHLGTNILLAIDLRTFQWTHISGWSAAKMSITEPPLRRFASTWVVPSQRRIYFLYGSASRSGAKMHKLPHGEDEDFMLEDLWSFAVDGKTWRRERLRGNLPSPRTEMASCYNLALGRAVMYGGYSASANTRVGQGGPAPFMMQFAYYGDSFLFDPETGRFAQILTRGFPSYRAQSRMLVDENTGKTYLFGGYTNAQFVPSKQVVSRSFGDLWQLCIDMPGGHLEDANLQLDTDAPRMGPWKYCLACGSVGYTWRKCGGSCGGKYYFCSNECLREGWKDHKKAHGCRKI